MKYEQLKDIKAYLRLGDFLASTDMRSGYHMVPMARDAWQYLAIRFRGKTLFYPCLCFGLASACEGYTCLMGEVLRPLRGGQLASERLTTMIDDTQSTFSSKAQGKFRMHTMVLLYAALGFFLSIEKCSLVPVQQNKFLGLIVDSQQLRFVVPADKIAGCCGIPAAAALLVPTDSPDGRAYPIVCTCGGAGAAVYARALPSRRRQKGKLKQQYCSEACTVRAL